jgi:hypothetical protein
MLIQQVATTSLNKPPIILTKRKPKHPQNMPTFSLYMTSRLRNPPSYPCDFTTHPGIRHNGQSGMLARWRSRFNPRQGWPLYIWMYTPSAVSIFRWIWALYKSSFFFHFNALPFTLPQVPVEDSSVGNYGNNVRIEPRPIRDGLVQVGSTNQHLGVQVEHLESKASYDKIKWRGPKLHTLKSKGNTFQRTLYICYIFIKNYINFP